MNYIQRLSVNDGLIILEEGYENLNKPWREQFTVQVINTRDALVKAGLKNLGWTSPEDTARMTEEMRNLEDELLMVEDALRAHDAAAVDWTEDARNYGRALNEAAWTFVEECPEKSTLLFNNTKQPLRAAILRYAAALEKEACKTRPAALTTQREGRDDG